MHPIIVRALLATVPTIALATAVDRYRATHPERDTETNRDQTNNASQHEQGISFFQSKSDQNPDVTKKSTEPKPSADPSLSSR